MAAICNAVEVGAVASLARPGGNITGSSFLWEEVNAKRVDILKAGIPHLTRVGVLVNPDRITHKLIGWRSLEPLTQGLNVKAHPLEVRRLDELDAALTVAKAQSDAVVVTEEVLFSTGGTPRRIADLAMRPCRPRPKHVLQLIDTLPSGTAPGPARGVPHLGCAAPLES